MDNRIDSAKNERVKQWAKLHQKKARDESGMFLIEGEHLIEEALKINCVETLLILQDHENQFQDFINTIQVTQEILNKLSENISEVSMIAVCHVIQMTATKHEKGILLDGIQDPGNMGTIIRTAVSFGYDYIIASKDCVDIYNQKCIRSTQGALFQIPILKQDLKESIEELKAKGVVIFGTALQNALPLKQIKRPDQFALVFGNEGQGISAEILACCNQTVFVEMEHFESLNVAVAAAICLYTMM